MDDDLKAAIARVERAAKGSVLQREIAEPPVLAADLRTLLSAFRQRDEALRDMLAMYGSKYDGEMRLKEPAEIEVIETARAILTESETNAR